MSFFGRWFSKSPSDLLTKGDKYMESDSFFDARTCYEDGLRLCSGAGACGDMKTVLSERIDTANYRLAERNLHEAEFAFSRGDAAKAIDHLELAKELTCDAGLREKAEKMLHAFSRPEPVRTEQVTASSCSSCSGASCGEPADTVHADDSLPHDEYYELLIQQLPAEEYQRYARLGDDFAHAYIAASRDEHAVALSGFEQCRGTLPQDIYCYEKGKVLHRLGNDLEAEQLLRTAVQQNSTNSLAWLNLALVLGENHRFQDALDTIETMVAKNILPEQALLLRADIFEVTGNHEGAVNQYVELLQTPYARPAAEKLHAILMRVGRQSDAAVIFKKYLNKSCH